MAERVLRSPGVTTRELDLSAPGRVRPQGIPAGIVGTAQKGPAFVPVTFATANDFANLFGASEGKHFGAMAVNEWMRNARSGLYLRVLGVGDGKKSNSDGSVTNAGFIVGQDMRDKDRIGKTSLETDGSADIPVANPHAGGSVDNALGVVATDTDNVVAVPTEAGQQEIFTVSIADNGAGYDGLTIAYEDIHGAASYVYFMDAQYGTRTDDGTAITDGGFEIFNINTNFAGATLVRLDATGLTTGADIALLLEGELDTLYPSGAAEDWDTSGNGVVPYLVAGADITIDWSIATTDLANNPGAAYLGGAGSLNSTDLANNPSILVAQDASGAAAADVTFSAVTPAVAYALNTPDGTGLELSFTVDANISVPADSSITLVGADGTAEIVVELNAGGVATADTATSFYSAVDTDAVAAGAATSAAIHAALGLAYAALQTQNTTNADGDLLLQAFLPNPSAAAGDLTFTDQGTSVEIAFALGTSSAESVPTLTISENSPSSPAGRVYFLGANHTAGQSPANDYLGQATSKRILRGVLMFPSGVIPGIEDNNVDLIEANLPDGAFGEYGTNKDIGNSSGLGRVSASGDFVIALNGFSNDSYEKILTASFETTSPIYLSKVFNTDPTKIQEKGHYLYAHYDVPDVLASVDNGNASAILRPGANEVTDYSGTVHSTADAWTPTFEDWRQRFEHAATPWIMSQTLGESAKKLFKFHMLDAGSVGHGQVKVSIANITKSTDLSSDYGSFDVQIRSANDTDLDPQILQQFSAVNLNPSSDRYIARVIGDQNTFFEFEKDIGKQKLVTEGLYPNNSQYVRVEVNDQVEAGQMEATALPLGFQGKNHLVLDGQALSDMGDSYQNLVEPPLPFRESVSVGSGATKVVDSRFYWGMQNQMVSNAAEKNRDSGIVSLVDNLTKWYPNFAAQAAWVGDNKGASDSTGNASLDADEYNDNAFSLEKLWIRCVGGNTSNAVDPTQWHEAVYIRDGNASGETWDSSGSYFQDADGNNKSSGYRYLDVAKDFGSSASKKFFKFSVPMQGGWDGLDILDADKASMSTMAAFREMDTTGSAYYGGPDGSTTAAFRKALDILSEKSDVDIQLLATPGMRSAGITDYAIDKTEDRFDALYIMDMPAYDHDDKLVLTRAQETSVTNTAQNLSNRNLDTSFAATYFPDLVIADGSNNVVAPPSVAVLGALSLNDSVAHPWYAPAGFARGALASTIETAVKLNRSNMDVLYDSDINPITSFPQTGSSVIVFGQKTMLQAQSALDRVNVRRLLIDVRRKVRKVANQVLFEPNRESTLARFSALVNPILGRIQQQQGLDRYKVVIDTTTTTQQDVENNTIRGKIFLQPTRSIEFISLDFVVTNAGAEI